jgi:hypothetical protein
VPDESPSSDWKPEEGWVEVASYASALEAEIARAVIEAGGFDAIAQGDDMVGLFGPNFMGRSQRGARVLVPAEQAAAVRTFLANRG